MPPHLRRRPSREVFIRSPFLPQLPKALPKLPELDWVLGWANLCDIVAPHRDQMVPICTGWTTPSRRRVPGQTCSRTSTTFKKLVGIGEEGLRGDADTRSNALQEGGEEEFVGFVDGIAGEETGFGVLE